MRKEKEKEIPGAEQALVINSGLRTLQGIGTYRKKKELNSVSRKMVPGKEQGGQRSPRKNPPTRSKKKKS